ncbi:uncharacterized protein LOC8041370 [Ixodes scapularis]|uniref:uncharacterized protein LOC8041370 n=1 Tax=Ixodes scapularis TaxID=6945 RepID=UPI001AD6C108|nr:uncharacterized protein LOC8041370 [Ixodes scapularis]
MAHRCRPLWRRWSSLVSWCLPPVLWWFCVSQALTVQRASASTGCKLSEFMCDNGRCVSLNRYCDGTDDCGDASDEQLVCSNCNRTYYGQRGVKYALRMSEPFQRHLAFVCRMNFVAHGEEYGDLVEITFLSFQVGFYHLASNSSPSCLQGHMKVTEDQDSNDVVQSDRPYSAQPLRPVKDRIHHGHHRPSTRLVDRDKTDVVTQRAAEFGGFCGSLVGRSATFYSARRNVSLTVSFPVSSSVNMATTGVFLTYRFLKSTKTHDDVFYGDPVPGSYCDRVFTDCHDKQCRIRSPNYPGFYLRNVTCTYHIKQTQAPPGLVSQIVLNQRNEYKITIHSGQANAGGVLYSALTTECAGDVVRISDGSPSSESVTLLEFCGSGPLPDVTSSGPDVTVQLISVPYQQLLESRMELDISVRFVDPTEFRMTGRTCKFILDSSDRRSGQVHVPRHTIPANTVCTFEFKGRSRFERVWLYFTSYFVPDRQPWTSVEKCDVSQLEVYDSAVFDNGAYKNEDNDTSGLMGRFCEKSSPRVCSHANDYPNLIPARPCHRSTESYFSSSPTMTLRYKVFQSGDVTSKTSSFTARYEFVDTSQNGEPMNDSLCNRLFKSRTKSRGRVASPKNTFFYGRGGEKDLTCAYRFLGTSQQRVRIRIDKLHLSTEGCSTLYDANQLRYTCRQGGRLPTSVRRRRLAELNMSESWFGISIPVGCLCSNSTFLSSPLELTSVGSDVILSFTVRGMAVHEDFTSFGFEATYEFLPPSDCGADTGLLRGHVGEAELSSPVFQEDGPGVGAYRSGIFKRCRWLLEASPDKYLYLQVIGGRQSISDCGDNRLLVYSGENLSHVTLVCASTSSVEDPSAVDIFSPAWANETRTATSLRPERLLLETLCSEESSSFRVRWMEVTRPFFRTRSGQTMRNVDCLYECPELDACISPELWCDGVAHCPSGYDEVPENCSRFPTLQVILGCAGALVVFVVALGTLALMRRSCQFKKSKSSTPSGHPVSSEDVPMDSI